MEFYIIDHANFWPPFPRGGGQKKLGIKSVFLLTQTVPRSAGAVALMGLGIPSKVTVN